MRLTWFDNRHTMRIEWPGLTSGVAFSSAEDHLSQLGTVRLYCYEFVARTFNQSQFYGASSTTGVYSFFDTTSVQETMKQHTQNFGIYAGTPVDGADATTPVSNTDGYVDDVTTQDIFGLKLKYSEIPAGVLLQRKSQGWRPTLVRVHRFKPPKRMPVMVENPEFHSTEDNIFGFRSVDVFRRMGIATKMNARVTYPSESASGLSYIPRDGFHYYQIWVMSNPMGESATYLPRS